MTCGLLHAGVGGSGGPMCGSRAIGCLRWLWLSVFFVLPLLAAAQSGPADSLHAAAAPHAERVLRVASGLDFPPLALVNADGSADGFSVELFKAVARVTGLQYRIHVGSLDAIKDDVIAGKADLFINMAITPQRAMQHDFTAPHTIVEAGVFVRKGGARLAAPEDLRGKSLLVVAGDSVQQWAARQPWAGDLEAVDTIEHAMQLLAQGRHDAVLVARIVGQRVLDSEHLDNIEMLHLALPGAEQKFAFAVKKGDAQLLAKLNDGLAIVRGDGTYGALYHRWLEPATTYLVPLRFLARYGEPILGAAVVLLALVSIRLRMAVQVLRRHRGHLVAAVDARTIELRDSEARQRAIIDSALDAIAVHDQQGRFLRINPAAERMFGYRQEQVLGRKVTEVFVPVHAELESQRFDERVARGGTLAQGRRDIEVLHSDGHAFHVEISTTRSDVGNQVMFTLFARDITEKKHAQEALARTARARSEFMNSATHELRTPLNSIIGFAELLKDQVPGPLNPMQVEFASDILASGERLLALVEAMLELSALENGNAELRPVPLDVGAVLQERAGALRESAEARGIAVTLDLAPDVGLALLDPQALRRMLGALLDNAVKFSPHGGTITLGLRPHGDGLEVVVADTGIGMAAQDVARVFDPFVQVDGKLARGFGGLGLGLAAVRLMAQLMGGRIECESELGKGTTVRLRFPMTMTTTMATTNGTRA